ncbi:MAG: Anaerobic glycerol-3-phosphate dehydrogenase subunit B [Acinetobacter bereziniae]|uniref:Anaerobic glycerol-3-phosphate dehydrogenase subunit B n=1 Tax=Acinetobacter bereziniae TaxID=106648 RepID=A0A833UNN5_ACIBZ|nr:MAG: Anaerobic glycerol-3-phosphate dehydrogenase subunit B [Acinetobacter bereziniae]
MNYDVVIIGGSYAGLSAALPLARARKNIMIVDAGLRRNRFAAHSHNFLTQDGRAPSAIITDAKQQLEKYSTITWMDASVIDVQAVNNQYEVFTEDENNKYSTARFKLKKLSLQQVLKMNYLK